MLFTYSLDAESSNASFWVVICILNEFISMMKQQLSDCCCWSARATCITEVCLAFFRTCILWIPVTKHFLYEQHWHHIHFLNHLWIIITDCFSATINSITAHCLKCTSLYHTKFPAGCSELSTEIIAHISCWLWLRCIKCCKTFLGNPCNSGLSHEMRKNFSTWLHTSAFV